jgi:hypothetical protein
MAAYGYIVRKFIRDGEVTPEKFVGHNPQAATAGATVEFKSYDASGVVCAELSIPNVIGSTAAETFTFSLPYKFRILPGTQCVPLAATAANVAIAIGKHAVTAGLTSIQTFTTAVNAANTAKLPATHVLANDVIDPTLADPERLRITVTKTTGANDAAMQVFLYFVRAD